MATFMISLVVAFAFLLTLSTSLGNNNQAKIMAELATKTPGIRFEQVYGKDGSFIVNVTIGNSPLIYTVRLDTDSDLIWTNDRCTAHASPKLSCSSALCKAAESITTCKSKPDICEYNYNNGTVQVELHTGTFKFPGNVNVPNLGFGCSIPGNNDAGGLGLGKGHLSLVSQLKASVFAYCLPSYDSPDSTGFLWVGGPPAQNHTLLAGIITVPLVANPPQKPSAYYVDLRGISVGGKLLAIKSSEFAVNHTNGGGGVVVDTGSTLTYLKASVFGKVVEEVKKQIRRTATARASPQSVPQLCFTVKSKNFKFPQIAFHFPDNKNLTFPTGNSYREFDNKTSCLAMAQAPSYENGMSSLGNIQQQNTFVAFDRVKQTVAFLPVVGCQTM